MLIVSVLLVKIITIIFKYSTYIRKLYTISEVILLLLVIELQWGLNTSIYSHQSSAVHDNLQFHVWPKFNQWRSAKCQQRTRGSVHKLSMSITITWFLWRRTTNTRGTPLTSYGWASTITPRSQRRPAFRSMHTMTTLDEYKLCKRR